MKNQRGEHDCSRAHRNATGATTSPSGSLFDITVNSDAKKGSAMKKILSLSALIVLLCFTPAMAGEGPYLGGGLVYNNPLSSDIDYLDPGVGLDLKFGYNFGTVALEATLMGSSHNDTDPGYGSADFTGFSLDLRIFLSPVYDPNQIYLLVGLGAYSIKEYSPFWGADTQLNGGGWNLGAGVEHYLNENVALNFGLIYRIIRYDEVDIGGTTFSLSPEAKGDTLTLEAGINYHF
jgi:opacity protein-like surface antigen